MTTTPKNIFIGFVDNDSYTRVGMQYALHKSSPEGYVYNVVYAPTVPQLLTIMESQKDLVPQIHVVLLDILLDDNSQLRNNIRTFVELDIPVLVISNVVTPEKRRQAYQANASGVVSKKRSPKALATDILDVVQGKYIFTPDFAVAFTNAPDPIKHVKLAPQELETMRLYAIGYEATEIAAMLKPVRAKSDSAISPLTVKTYLSRIRKKYADVGRDATGRKGVRQRAYEDGLITHENFIRALDDEAFNVVCITDE
ncbi:hypothetical protein [Glutamicibacter sp. NPDC087344]|uniref:hypothetical protein n=1 Tax=Glutamicibacter sp. NPDC087344 TaxID=3363994 RepID=UPI0038018320